MGKGTATIDVTVDALPQALMLLPSTYRVIGSASSIAPDTVRLVVASDDLTTERQVHLTCMVKDAGSTRTVTMEPAGRVDL